MAVTDLDLKVSIFSEMNNAFSYAVICLKNFPTMRILRVSLVLLRIAAVGISFTHLQFQELLV